MRLVIVSDTHSRHEELGTLAGDVLIHCGDGLNAFAPASDALQKLDDWFGRQAFAEIFYVGGNHDFEIERRATAGETVFENATYLQDQSFAVSGVRFYGSPWIPELVGWAYYRSTADLIETWSAIPENVDILITHSPPYGVLDRNSRNKHCGCPALAGRVSAVRPRLHCFGHVHASAGNCDVEGTTYANTSSVDSSYRIARAPFIFDL